jgi:hypothetical protein
VRPVTRNLVVAILVVVAGLLALGALPSLLGGGPATTVTATPAEGNHTAFNASFLSERQYPYTTGALVDGESEVYRGGPDGFKQSFSHSPYDEFDALQRQFPNAVDGEALYARQNGTLYRLELHVEDDA